MASNTFCTSCLRSLRQPTTRALGAVRTRPQHHIRPFTTTQPAHAAKPPPVPRQITPQSRGQEAPDPLAAFAASVRKTNTLKSTIEPYIAYGSTEDLFHACARQCDYTIPAREAEPPREPERSATGEDLGVGQGWWFESKSAGGLGLDVTFNSWAQVMMLHLYILTVRLRAFPAAHAKIWHQNILDHFFYAAEDRMAQWHGMSARTVRNKYMKDIYQQWRGVLFSYDEGLVKGDAVLAAAVWRNVFKADVQADVRDVGVVTAYLRRELARVDAVSDEKVGAGEVEFGAPGGLGDVFGERAKAWGEPFSAADKGVRDAVVEKASG